MKNFFLFILILLAFVNCGDDSEKKQNNFKGQVIQWGTMIDDFAHSVVLDSNKNIFVTGNFCTNESCYDFYDENFDLFLTKFDNDGNMLWDKKWGTDKEDNIHSITVDKAGNIYVTGYTWGSFEGYTNIGNHCGSRLCSDIFLTKFDNDGNMLWTKQWGTDYWEEGLFVAIDNSENIYVTGYSVSSLTQMNNTHQNIFLTKFDNDGNEFWTKQYDIGSFITVSNSMIIDSNNNIYIAGYSTPLSYLLSYEISNSLIMKLDESGNILWLKNLEIEEYNILYSIALDTFGNIYASGYKSGYIDSTKTSINNDIIVLKYDINGNLLWKKEFGETNFGEYGKGIVIDKLNNIYIIGNRDDSDAYADEGILLLKLDSDGNLLMIENWFNNYFIYGNFITIDDEYIYIVGETNSVLGKEAFGWSDSFLIKYHK